MVDVADSKSADGDIVWVRVPPPAPPRRSKLYIACSDFLCLWQKSQSALMPLLLLSKSKPLRWASIWIHLTETADSVSPLAPRRSKLYIACSDFLCLWQKSECAHAAAPPFQTEAAGRASIWVRVQTWKLLESILLRCSKNRQAPSVDCRFLLIHSYFSLYPMDQFLKANS